MGRRRVSPKPCAPSHLSSHTGRRCPATGTDQGAWGAGGPRPEQSVTQSVTVLTRRTTFCTQGEVPGQDGTGKFPKTARRREGRHLKEGRKEGRSSEVGARGRRRHRGGFRAQGGGGTDGLRAPRLWAPTAPVAFRLRRGRLGDPVWASVVSL